MLLLSCTKNQSKNGGPVMTVFHTDRQTEDRQCFGAADVWKERIEAMTPRPDMRTGYEILHHKCNQL